MCIAFIGIGISTDCRKLLEQARRGGACAHARRASAWGTAGDVCVEQAFGGPRGPGRRCWPGQPSDLLQPLSGALEVLARPALNA